MARNISIGIDIGSYEVKVLVCEAGGIAEKGFPRVLGAGFSESKGLRNGYIVNSAEVTRSIGLAIRQAEKSSGIKIKKAYVALGGIGLESRISHGSIMISRADSEITDLDVSHAIAASEKEIPRQISLNRKIIHTIPLQFKIDGKTVWGRPHGMKAAKLDVKTLFITCLEQHVNDIILCLEELGVEAEDLIASPIAASLVTINKLQKIAGCVLANIGSETVSVVVYENDIPISLEVFPIGSTDITNDIALGFKIPLEDAESAKRDRRDGGEHPKKKMEEIIDARLSDIFELIENHLKKIGRDGLLPAGIVFIGGGSLLNTIPEFAMRSLKLPSKVSDLAIQGNMKSPVRNVVFAVAYGLCLLGFTNTLEDAIGIKRGLRFLKSLAKTVVGWVKQFLP